MRKASRLFEIIQILRLAKRPVTAAQIADQLEVTQRSIYRDIAALQAMQVPIEGERGIGYILRPGFHLPPLMFTVEETEALVLALALLERTGEADMQDAARTIGNKIAASVPRPLRDSLSRNSLHAWGTQMPRQTGIDPALLRRVIREEEKLDLHYRDEQDRLTRRRIRPLALIYYTQWLTIVAWCDLRQDLRNFRVDRIESAYPAGDYFRGEGDRLRDRWVAGWRGTSPDS